MPNRISVGPVALRLAEDSGLGKFRTTSRSPWLCVKRNDLVALR